MLNTHRQVKAEMALVEVVFENNNPNVSAREDSILMADQNASGEDPTIIKEFNEYLNDTIIVYQVEEILPYRYSNRKRFPRLGQLARTYLHSPVSSTSAERLFSTCGDILVENRGLSSELFRKTLLLKFNQ